MYCNCIFSSLISISIIIICALALAVGMIATDEEGGIRYVDDGRIACMRVAFV